MNKKDRFGINMKQWMSDHERGIEEAISSGGDPVKVLEWHLIKTGWLQHERLVHFIVTFMTFIGFLFMTVFTFFPEFSPGIGVVMLIFLVLLAFYLRHYFILENGVQHWYRIAEELHDMIRKKETTDE